MTINDGWSQRRRDLRRGRLAFFCARVLSFSLKKNEASSSFVVGRVLFLHFDSSSDDDGNGNGNGGREIRFARDDDENDERRLR